jgi:hypothetical protein
VPVKTETFEPVTLAEAVEIHRTWLELDSNEVLYVVWGAIAGNLLPGEPAWLLVVDVSGGGKTEVIRACGDLPHCAHISSLTEPALLSGTPERDRSADSTGGVLRVIGDRGVLIAKDFTSVLSMERNQRGTVLAALREIYDGDYSRPSAPTAGRRFAGAVRPALSEASRPRSTGTTW